LVRLWAAPRARRYGPAPRRPQGPLRNSRRIATLRAWITDLPVCSLHTPDSASTTRSAKGVTWAETQPESGPLDTKNKRLLRLSGSERCSGLRAAAICENEREQRTPREPVKESMLESSSVPGGAQQFGNASAAT
jgi:hypothetical protein